MNTGPILGVVFVASLVSGVALAEPGRSDERFAELDTDGNGVITQAEVQAQIATHFAEADSDGNGTLSEEEAVAFHRARREERREHHRNRRFGWHAGDNDVIDFEEFAEHGMRRFERADLDENGEVTETEMRIVADLHHDRGRRGWHGRRGWRGRHHGEGTMDD